ncbi:hypothetical protein PORCRE_1485 [Porphyromonas crevioricanis JCM 15906]|uniref:Uncharacterized protein n=1 Tax=Porphyromonas crevioricanis JCM 15906 TaxID=1305617 RepID=T1CPL9_9PORP|nr:hypothetical protein PORCRE_1485 [Porphyromonas crevioricanis JCM 15906]
MGTMKGKSHRQQNENSSLFFFHCKNIYTVKGKSGEISFCSPKGKQTHPSRPP